MEHNQAKQKNKQNNTININNNATAFLIAVFFGFLRSNHLNDISEGPQCTQTRAYYAEVSYYIMRKNE